VGDPVVLVVALAGDHLTDECQPLRGCHGLSLGRGCDRGDERLIAQSSDSSPVQYLEHVFDFTAQLRHASGRDFAACG
jgi:hypothetical protein